ncbi:hypothetical protein ACQP1W_32905 [Spirillospora sp. CA-255316]
MKDATVAPLGTPSDVVGGACTLSGDDGNSAAAYSWRSWSSHS